MKTSSTSQPYYSGSPACSPTAPSGESYCGGYLNPSSYAAYASYLEDFVTYFQSNGVSLYAISMQNEPDYSAESGQNYESCSWTAQQMDTWVASLTANAATNPITTKLIMPESFQFNPAQAATTLEDPNAVDNVSIVGGHLYGVSPSPYPFPQGVSKDLWMTEHFLTPANSSSPVIGDAVQMAEEIHNSMVTGQYNAYVWWGILGVTTDVGNWGLISSSATPTYYGYAIGQFSQFIQPGFVRASATASPTSGVYFSAYKNPGGGSYHYVIVGINANTNAESVSFTINNGTVTSMTPYATTATGGLAPQTSIGVSNGQFNYTLPAQSIVSFVQ